MKIIAAIIAGVVGGYLTGSVLCAVSARLTRRSERQLLGSWPGLLVYWMMVVAGWSIGRAVWLALSPGKSLRFGYPLTSQSDFIGIAGLAAGSSAWFVIHHAGRSSHAEERQGGSAQ